MDCRRIKRARIGAGLSRKQVAERTGYTESVVRSIEAGLSPLDSSTLRILCQAMGVRMSYLVRPFSLELSDIHYLHSPLLSTPQRLRLEAETLDLAERHADLRQQLPPGYLHSLRVPHDIPDRITHHAQLDDAAKLLATAWRLNSGHCLADICMAYGVLVCHLQRSPPTLFRGLTANASGQPIIAISANWPTSRIQVITAKEIGRLILPPGTSESLLTWFSRALLGHYRPASPDEHPTLTLQLVRQAIDEEMISVSKGAEILGVSAQRLRLRHPHFSLAEAETVPLYP